MPSLERVQGPIPYEVHRRRRRTIGLTVKDDGTVEVRAPLRTSKKAIAEVVQEHLEWIREKRRENRERRRRLRARRFDHGDEIPYLGRRLRLVVSESDRALSPDPRLDGDDLVVHVPAGLATAERRAATREAVGRWLLGQARDLVHRRHARAARLVGDAAESITIKDMHTRWGSCGPSRKMSLNWRLVMAPLHVLDYVLVHELTHIRIPDHSARFWDRVAAACPRSDEAREWLSTHGADLEL
jgi:predicted metal-dependent hydrolase